MSSFSEIDISIISGQQTREAEGESFIEDGLNCVGSKKGRSSPHIFCRNVELRSVGAHILAIEAFTSDIQKKLITRYQQKRTSSPNLSF